ncbi:hypothetical protein [Caulobacter henricii]|uniref:Uncharacterized protein n=1 Tax=Caulobacter henricii TaxID=69395 RepID=A0A0P0P1D6_9CAUL|nr:hypothetical protein [Caulobacter henricii]ALL14288.1 hypothetical protein AQ619_13560 [Caulobacter henricii]
MSAAQITNDQAFLLISSGVLLGWYAHVLSDFEAETIADVAGRWLKHRSQTILTAAEWAVVEAAVEAMRTAANRPLVAESAA